MTEEQSSIRNHLFDSVLTVICRLWLVLNVPSHESTSIVIVTSHITTALAKSINFAFCSHAPTLIRSSDNRKVSVAVHSHVSWNGNMWYLRSDWKSHDGNISACLFRLFSSARWKTFSISLKTNFLLVSIRVYLDIFFLSQPNENVKRGKESWTEKRSEQKNEKENKAEKVYRLIFTPLY